MAGLLGGLGGVRILDYGSGGGVFAAAMAKHGFEAVEEYDPFSHPERPAGKFDVVLCSQC